MGSKANSRVEIDLNKYRKVVFFDNLWVSFIVALYLIKAFDVPP